jgi:hypothetical protein
VPASCEFNFDDTFNFDFDTDNSNSKIDSSILLKLNSPIHLTILRHRKNEKPVVIGTKNIEWRKLLYCNSAEINAEILPVDLTHKGSLGIIQLNVNLLPNLTKNELCLDE